jgi:hypothetical protein
MTPVISDLGIPIAGDQGYNWRASSTISRETAFDISSFGADFKHVLP